MQNDFLTVEQGQKCLKVTEVKGNFHSASISWAPTMHLALKLWDTPGNKSDQNFCPGEASILAGGEMSKQQAYKH